MRCLLRCGINRGLPCYHLLFIYSNIGNISTGHVQPVIERILGEISLRAAVERFKEEKIDEKIAVSLNDDQLIRLGVATIGAYRE